jgi:hypothetical protein
VKHLLFIAFIVCPVLLSAQTVIDGVIRDSVSNKGINGVVVTVVSERGDIIGYSLTNMDGLYSIRINTAATGLKLNISFLGYSPKDIAISNKTQTIDVVLQSSEIQLKEVVIKSNVMWSREDTLVYSVGAFCSQQDRTIGDILKKLPGIEVSKTGGVRYNGEAINKFYIEGLDLLDKKYGIATNNIPVDAVVNVEVIENHQPVSLLKDMMGTGQAAINLKLKNNKMSRPVGSANIGIGGLEDLLWNVDAFALKADGKSQAIGMYKTNNTGKNIANDLTEHSLLSGYSSDREMPVSGLFSDVMLNSPPIEEERYLFNKTHLATINSLWKTGVDRQIRLNINYLNDSQKESIYQNNSYFMPDSSLIINELSNTRKERNYIDGIATYTDNSSGHYISNQLKFQGEWNKQTMHIESSDLTAQQFYTPEYLVSNDFEYVKKRNRRIWNISSFIRYSSLPQRLNVNIDTIRQRINQKVNRSGLYMNNNSSLSFSKGHSLLYLILNFTVNIESLNSNLSNHPLLTNKLESEIGTDYIEVSLSPSYTFKKNKMEFSVDVPFSYRWLNTEYKLLNKNKDSQFFYVDPKMKLTYKINQFWQTTLSYNYRHTIGDITDFADSYIMTDYNTANIKAGILQKRESQSIGVKVNFRNPLTTLFFNTSLTYSSSERNLLNQQYFINRQIVISNLEQDNSTEIWAWRNYIGKHFGDINTGLSLSTMYNVTNLEKNQQGLLVPLNSIFWSITPKINTKMSDALSMSYQAEIINNKLKIKTSPSSIESSTYQVSQKLTGYCFLNSKIELNTQMEYLYNELSKDLSFSLLFANVGAKYKNKDIEYSLSINNIFNKKEYNYTVYSSLDTYSYNYRLRPINILATVSFK